MLHLVKIQDDLSNKIQHNITNDRCRLNSMSCYNDNNLR